MTSKATMSAGVPPRPSWLAALAVVCGLSPGAVFQAHAQQAPVPVPSSAPVPILASASAIRLDGQLSEDFWSRAQPIVDFVQREPAEGAAPTQRTEARVA